MARHGSAPAREEKPHVTETFRTISNNYSETQPKVDDDSTRQKIEALSELICGAGDEAAAALLVLMATLQTAAQPKALANTAKHLAFTRCGELNFHGVVDAQVAVFERELLASNTLAG